MGKIHLYQSLTERGVSGERNSGGISRRHTSGELQIGPLSQGS